MPEDPEKHDALTRYVRRQRLKNLAVAAAIVAPFVVVFAVINLPEQDIGQPESARVVSTALQASDELARVLVNIELPDGTLAVMSLAPYVAPSAGDLICVTRVRRPVIGRINFRPAPPNACASG